VPGRRGRNDLGRAVTKPPPLRSRVCENEKNTRMFSRAFDTEVTGSEFNYSVRFTSPSRISEEKEEGKKYQSHKIGQGYSFDGGEKKKKNA